MLIGTYEHNLDGKNRVFVPVKFRDELGNNFIYKFHASKYPSIQLYSQKQFESARDEALMRARSPIEKRNILAQFYLGTGEASYDGQGRIVLNQLVTNQAGISKQCIFVGFGDYVEIMSPENYQEYLSSITASNTAAEQALEDESAIYYQYQSEGKFLNLGSINEV